MSILPYYKLICSTYVSREYEAIIVSKDRNGRYRVEHSYGGGFDGDTLKADIPAVKDAIQYARNHSHLLDSEFPRDADGNLAESEWEVDVESL